MLILGRGGAGKSTLAVRLGAVAGLPVVELDEHAWGPDLASLSPQRWAVAQENLVRAESWIMDGDLGPHDVLDVRGLGNDFRVLGFALEP